MARPGAATLKRETGFCPQVVGAFLLTAEKFLRDSASAYDGLLKIAEEVAAYNLAYAIVLIKVARRNDLSQSWFFYVFERMVYMAMAPDRQRGSQ